VESRWLIHTKHNNIPINCRNEPKHDTVLTRSPWTISTDDAKHDGFRRSVRGPFTDRVLAHVRARVHVHVFHCPGECRRTTEKPADDDGPAALEAAYRRLIFDKTKESLAKHLIEGLYLVSKRYRHDPFGCLGRWLLIRADIRDEDRIEHELAENFLQTSR